MASFSPSRDWAQDAALIQRAQRGNRRAFDELARRWREPVLATVRARVEDRETAEDIVQEVLTRVWDRLATLRDPQAFPAWLHVIAVHACGMWLRRRPQTAAQLEDTEVADPGPDPLEMVLAEETRTHWRDALLALPEDNRRALVLHVWGRYSYEEIAARLRVPLTTVEGRIFRARAQVRRLLGQEETPFMTRPIQEKIREDQR